VEVIQFADVDWSKMSPNLGEVWQFPMSDQIAEIGRMKTSRFLVHVHQLLEGNHPVEVRWLAMSQNWTDFYRFPVVEKDGLRKAQDLADVHHLSQMEDLRNSTAVAVHRSTGRTSEFSIS
jgi:hypothetical protein